MTEESWLGPRGTWTGLDPETGERCRFCNPAFWLLVLSVLLSLLPPPLVALGGLRLLVFLLGLISPLPDPHIWAI